MRRAATWPCAALVGAVLAGCGSIAVAPPAAVTASTRTLAKPAQDAASDDLEQRWLARASLAESTGDLAQAAVALDVLLLIDASAYRQRRAELRLRTEQALGERLQLAQQEHKKGRLEAAELQYLRVLALQPRHAEAAQALRDIDRARNRRDHLGQPSRLTLTRRSSVPATTSAAAAARLDASMELEHAAMLATQGETAEAIALLEAQLDRDKADSPARAMLVDLYYRKAVALRGSDDAAARAALARALQLAPAHAPSRALAKQLMPAAAAMR